MEGRAEGRGFVREACQGGLSSGRACRLLLVVLAGLLVVVVGREPWWWGELRAFLFRFCFVKVICGVGRHNGTRGIDAMSYSEPDSSSGGRFSLRRCAW